MTEVFNAKDTADLAIQEILKAGSFDLGPKGHRIENSSDWTEEKFRQKAQNLNKNEGPEGDFDD